MKDLRSASGLFISCLNSSGQSAFSDPLLALLRRGGDDFRTLFRDSPQYPFALGDADWFIASDPAATSLAK
jgi:hypothetical protein